MLLVRCSYCQGSGKQVCACQTESAGRVSPAQRALSMNKRISDDKSAEDSKNKSQICPLCEGSGEVTCAGCCGSGFVEMPALA